MERWKGLAIGGVNLMGKHTVAIRQNQGVRAKKSIKGFILNYSSGKFSIIWGKTHFSLFPEVPSWNRLNDRGPRTNSTGSVRSQSPLLNQFGQGRDLVELTGSILQILPKRDA